MWFASKIYCTGELLRQVQMAKLFNDNKAFVDMKLTAAPGEITFLFCFWLVFWLSAYLNVDFYTI